MGVSKILMYIADKALAFTRAAGSAELSDQVKERASEGNETFDGVVKELNALESAVSDYEQAFQNARLQAHKVATGGHREADALIACNSYERLPEASEVRRTVRRLRALGSHNEDVAAAATMRLEAEMEIAQEQLEVQLGNQDAVTKTTPKAPFDSDAAALVKRRSLDRAFGHARMLDRMAAQRSEVVNTAASVTDRLSRLIGTLEYIQETMSSERSTFVSLDKKVCEQYRAKVDTTP